MIDPMERVEPISLKKVHNSGSSSDSGAWVQVSGDLEFTPKFFNDPKNTSSDKENNPINDSQTMLMLNDLNITDGTDPGGLPERPPNFVGPYYPECMLKWPRCLCMSESDWEDTATQQIPRTSSPYPDDSDKNLEKLETEVDEDLDEIDYRARPANDRRKPKSILRCRPTLRRSPPNWLKNDCPTPLTSPEYITMVASPQQTKQPSEVRGIWPERRKMPCGWPKCLRKIPPKLVMHNSDLYNNQMENHHYEEHEEIDNRLFINMQIQDNMNGNYEPVGERETAILTCIYICKLRFVLVKVKFIFVFIE